MFPGVIRLLRRKVRIRVLRSRTARTRVAMALPRIADAAQAPRDGGGVAKGRFVVAPGSSSGAASTSRLCWADCSDASDEDDFDFDDRSRLEQQPSPATQGLSSPVLVAYILNEAGISSDAAPGNGDHVRDHGDDEGLKDHLRGHEGMKDDEGMKGHEAADDKA